MIAVLIIDYSNMQDTPFIKLPVELDALLRTSLYLNIVHETFKVSGRQFNVCDNRLLPWGGATAHTRLLYWYYDITVCRTGWTDLMPVRYHVQDVCNW